MICNTGPVNSRLPVNFVFATLVGTLWAPAPPGQLAGGKSNLSRSGATMIYEVRTYTLKPGHGGHL